LIEGTVTARELGSYRPEIEERMKTGEEKASLSESEPYPFRIKFVSGGNRKVN
jgi:hypothetical protein